MQRRGSVTSGTASAEGSVKAPSIVTRKLQTRARSPTVAGSVVSSRGKAGGLKPNDALSMRRGTVSGRGPPSVSSAGGDKQGSAGGDGDGTDGVQREVMIRMNALKEKLSLAQKQLKDAEGERDTAFLQLAQFQIDHKKEVDLMDKELEESRKKREDMQARVDRVDKLENAIIKLYIEMKDRSDEDEEDDRDAIVAAEMRELRDQNPLVVLDSLRANLRSLLAFKNDYEDELKNRLHRKKLDSERQLEQLQLKIQEMGYFHDNAKANTEQAVKRMDEAEEARRRIFQECESQVAAIRSDNDQLSNLVRSKEEEIQALRKQLSQKEQVVKHKDIKLMRISALESQIQANKLQHQFDLQKLQAQHVQSLKMFQKEIGKFTKTEAENKVLEAEINKAKGQIEAFKKDIHLAKHTESEERVAKLEKMLAERDAQLKEFTVQLRSMRYSADQANSRSKTLKKEYDKLFEQVGQRVKNKKKVGAMGSMEIHRAAEENPNFVSVYKSKLKAKEREVQELNNKVRRLLAAEHRNKVMAKNFETERSRLEGELASLRMQVGRTGPSGAPRPGTASGAMRPRTAVGLRGSAGGGGGGGGGASSGAGGDIGPEFEELRRENERMRSTLKEYQTLKSISVTTAAAYERLLQQTTQHEMPVPGTSAAGGGDAAGSVLETPGGGGSGGVDAAGGAAAGGSAAAGKAATSFANRRMAGVGRANSTLPVGQLL